MLGPPFSSSVACAGYTGERENGYKEYHMLREARQRGKRKRNTSSFAEVMSVGSRFCAKMRAKAEKDGEECVPDDGRSPEAME